MIGFLSYEHTHAILKSTMDRTPIVIRTYANHFGNNVERKKWIEKKTTYVVHTTIEPFHLFQTITNRMNCWK